MEEVYHNIFLAIPAREVKPGRADGTDTVHKSVSVKNERVSNKKFIFELQ